MSTEKVKELSIKEFIVNGVRVLVEDFPSSIPGLRTIPQMIYHDNNDDRPILKPCSMEISDCNFNTVDSIVGNYMTHGIMEIGVSRNTRSFTDALLNNKPDTIPYLGVDIDWKTHLDNKDKNIYTIKADSKDQDRIRAYAKEIGLSQISILFIDGWHSLNMVINDWKYSDLLSDNGIVIFHDTNYHPPVVFVEYIDSNMYDVIKYCTEEDDYGLAIAYRKKA